MRGAGIGHFGDKKESKEEQPVRDKENLNVSNVAGSFCKGKAKQDREGTISISYVEVAGDLTTVLSAEW
jgi:hypothetical protein